MSEREVKTLDSFIFRPGQIRWELGQTPPIRSSTCCTFEGNLNGLGTPLSKVCGAIAALCNQILQEFSMKNLHFAGGSSSLELFNKSFKTEVLGLK